MSFSHDRRGQSVVVGTVILFGFLILALSIYQVQFVPAENSEIEFEHSQELEGDFLDLRNELMSASTVGDARSTSIRLGTRYPQRTFFLNPPAASGSLSTTEERQLQIRNGEVSGSDNVEAFWANQTELGDGNITFNTRSLRYAPNYNEYRGSPDLVYEHSLVIAEFDRTALGRSGQSVIRDDRITLSLLGGQLSENGVERRSIDPRTLSASQQTVTLEREDTNGELEIILPTSITGAERLERLAAEWDDRIDDGSVSVTDDNEAIRLSIDADSYDLRLGKVGVGTGETPEDESDGYITNISDTGGVAVAEVRDRYNNPVTDANVTIDDGTGNQIKKTGADGRVRYTADNGPVDVTMWINDDNEEWENVTFENLGTAGGSGVGESRTFNVEWQGSNPRPVDVGKNDERITVNVADRDPNLGTNIENTSVDISVGVIEGSAPREVSFPDGSETDENGEVEVRLDVSENQVNDEFDLYASAGDDVDRLRVEIIKSEGETMADRIERVDGTTGVQGNDRPQFDFEVTEDEVTVDAAAIETQNDFDGIGADSAGGRSTFTLEGDAEFESDDSQNVERDFVYDFTPTVEFGTEDRDIEVDFDRLDTQIENLQFVDDEENADLIIAFQFGDGSVKEFYFEGQEKNGGGPPDDPPGQN